MFDLKIPNDLFQSTLPARGATYCCRHHSGRLPISIHAPRTGSDSSGCDTDTTMRISIHAPRTGSDAERQAQAERQAISIHAPRTGSDSSSSSFGASGYDFNPRSPHGERRARPLRRPRPHYFNPRSPHGERPDYRHPLRIWKRISIHAPRTGSDVPDGRVATK